MRNRLSSILFVSMLLPSATAHAQWPQVTPDGDPTVQLDTMLSLVVDPADYRGHDYVYLFDDGIVRVEEDGTFSQTFRQVIQVLTDDGVAIWAERSFSYRPSRERFRLNWLRVLNPDGSVISDGPDHMQETSPSVDRSSPIYTDDRLVRLTMAGVTAGTIVDASYTIDTHAPQLPGDVWFYWAVNTLAPVRRSRYVLDASEALALKVRESNLDFHARERRENGRRIRSWLTSDLDGVDVQSYAAFPNDIMMSIQVGGAVSWDDIGRWYHERARDRYEVTADIAGAHDKQLEVAKTLEDSLRVTHRWVAQDFRYVSLALGDGAYQPRSPAEVFTSGFGDCKDKTTLFVSLVRRLGVDAYPVLVHTEGEVDSLTPSILQFDHMIATVEQEGERRYFDLTSSLSPFGELPPSLQNEVGVVIRDGRETEVIVLPATPASDNRYDRVVAGALDRTNRFVGSITFTASGTEQYGLRQSFSNVHEMNDADLQELVRSYALSTIWDRAVIDSNEVFEGRDLQAPARVRIWFTSDGVLGGVGNKYLLHLPVVSFDYGSAVADLEAEGERRFPIDIETVNSASVHSSRLELELPEGWKVDLPDDVNVEGPFGYYRGDYRQVGRRLLVTREMGGLRGTLPPDSIDALKAWLNAVAEDAGSPLTIDRNGAPGIIAASDGTDPGRLPEILLTADDLSGATVSAEGAEAGTEWSWLSESDALEQYTRNFGASQMVFTVGESKLVLLGVGAQAFHTNGEAQKSQRTVELLDIKAMFEASVDQMGIPQASIGSVRSFDASGPQRQGVGWIVEMLTPVATLEVALAFMSRGRLSFNLMAVGTQGIRGEDLGQLFTVMEDRLAAEDEYLTDHDSTMWAKEEAETIAVADSVEGIALDQVLLSARDIPGSKVLRTAFTRSESVPTYRRTLDGRSFTFPVRNADALSVDMAIARFPNPASALKALIETERQTLDDFAREMMAEQPEFISMVASGDSSTIERAEIQTIGGRSLGRVVRLRSAFRTDMDVVTFVRDRYLVSVTVSRLVDGTALEDAVTLARQLDKNLVRVVPETTEASLAADVVERVESVLAAEDAVDSLADAREFNEMFAAIERANLDTAPVTFRAETWNTVCWWATLYVHVERAMPACEATVAPDTTNLARRDSRAVARAVAGDVEGAIADLEFIVEHSPDGTFLDIRTRWLDALLAGENPFTEEELAELRGSDDDTAN